MIASMAGIAAAVGIGITLLLEAHSARAKTRHPNVSGLPNGHTSTK